jgi:hypothetical protein
MRWISKQTHWLLLAFAAILMIAAPARAWSTKEHILLTRLAVQRLIADPATPPAMKKWLIQNTPNAPADLPALRQWFLTQYIGAFPPGADGLSFFATLPDLDGMSDHRPVAPYGVPESKLHFLDVELFNPDPADRNYAPDLSHKPQLQDFPKDVKDPRYKLSGFLPFRVEDSYNRLVSALRAGRLADKPAQYPHDDNAVRWAGCLAHYLEDGTQPQHATVDYKSRSYFHGAKDAPNVHAIMEYVMVDDPNHDYADLRKEYWPLLMAAIEKNDDPATSADPWTSTIQVALYGYDALPLIGQAAVAASQNQPPGRLDILTFFHFRGTVDGQSMTVMQLKARQQALAVHRVQQFWLKAWRQAAIPNPEP